MSELMTREEAVGLLATSPEVVTRHFGITRPEVLRAVAEVVLEDILSQDDGELEDLVEFPVSNVMKWTGLTRERVLKFEHQNYGARNQHMSLRQVKAVKQYFREASKVPAKVQRREG